MNNRKQTITQRLVTGTILLVVFVAFSGKILAQPSFVKKTVCGQTTTNDFDEDLVDCCSDFILPEYTGILFSLADHSIHPVCAVHASTLTGSRPPKWILNQQLKLGSLI